MTYSLVDADPDRDAICDAIRRGRVEVRTQPIPLRRAAWTMTRMAVGGLLGRLRVRRPIAAATQAGEWQP
jgi:hypothetical protein